MLYSINLHTTIVVVVVVVVVVAETSLEANL